MLIVLYIVFCSFECGSSVGPGARKPSVGEGIQSRRLLVLTLVFPSFFPFISAPFSGVCFNNYCIKETSDPRKCLRKESPFKIYV